MWIQNSLCAYFFLSFFVTNMKKKKKRPDFIGQNRGNKFVTCRVTACYLCYRQKIPEILRRGGNAGCRWPTFDPHPPPWPAALGKKDSCHPPYHGRLRRLMPSPCARIGSEVHRPRKVGRNGRRGIYGWGEMEKTRPHAW